MKSQLYSAKIHHQRLTPAAHKFTYTSTYYAFDLDELETLDREHWFFGYNRPGLIAVHDEDYLRSGEGSLKDKLFSRLQDKPYRGQIEQVMLATAPRLFNYSFNPVSFFYCYDKNSKILAVVAEVNNTFGERHTYILDQPNVGEAGLAYQAKKQFHVSPFNDMSGQYEFQFSDLKTTLNIAIDLVVEGVTKMKTALQGEPQKFTGRNVMKATLKDPGGPFMTLPRIHWEAAILYFRKKLDFFSAPLPASLDTHQVKKPTWTQRIAKNLVFRALERIENGGVLIRLPDGSQSFVGSPDGTNPFLHIKSYSFFTKVLRWGDIGFGEAYVEGLFECDDLSGLLQLFLNNREASINRRQPFISALGRLISTLLHRSRKNTLEGSRENISAHYDLSNGLFENFLDPSMTYSGALFEDGDSLERAQIRKLDALIERAEIGPEDHVLEIGCGWGSFAIRAALTTGCRVTGVTLSEEQLHYARERVREEGLESRVDLQLCDYRHLTGKYDKIVSVEMLEAVGHENQPVFLQTCDRLLKPGGKIAIQVITMADNHYQEYLREADWIQRYIFPGGCLVSLGHLESLLQEQTSLQMDTPLSMGGDYARTLQIWRKRFHQASENILELGFDEKFQRMWHYYLCYCEAGFMSGPIDVVQFSLTK